MKVDCRIRFCTDMDYTVDTERARMWKPFVSADLTTKMSTNLSTQNRIEDSRVDENRIEQNRIDKNISEYSSTEQYGGIGRHQEAFGVIAYDDNKYPDIITAF